VGPPLAINIFRLISRFKVGLQATFPYGKISTHSAAVSFESNSVMTSSKEPNLYIYRQFCGGAWNVCTIGSCIQ
jgi:hypothetical protein